LIPSPDDVPQHTDTNCVLQDVSDAETGDHVVEVQDNDVCQGSPPSSGNCCYTFDDIVRKTTRHINVYTLYELHFQSDFDFCEDFICDI